MRALFCLVVLVSGCHGCRHEAQDAGPPPLPRAEATVAPRETLSPSTFDFVAAPDGALLVWAAPRDRGSGIRSISMDGMGAPRAADRSVATLDQGILVLELAAAAGGDRAGVTWIEVRPAPPAVVVAGTYGDARGEAWAPKSDLGPGIRLPHEPRGRLALSASDDGILQATFRTTPGPCSATDGTCAHYVHVRLGDPHGAAPRGIERMEVRSPCDALVGASAWSAGTWFTSVCDVETSPLARIFAIRPETSYASVVDGPPSCPVDALVTLPDGVAARARCGEHGDAVLRLGLDGRAGATFEHARFDVTCSDAAHPTLRALSSDGASAITLALDAPRSHVEALLAPEVAPPGARAVWTGESILVAAPTEHDVFVQRWQCDDGVLSRTDPLE